MTKALWAGLDVGVETTRVCIIDSVGTVLHEATCATALKSVHRELRSLRRRRHARVAIEAAGGMYLARGLRDLGYVVDIYDQRQLSKFLRLRRNKTDAGDANGIAEAGRLGAGAISRVHLKTLDCQTLQSRLTIRRHLIRQRIATMNVLERQLELYGGRLRRRNLSQLRTSVELEIRKIFARADTDLVGELRFLVSHCEQLMEYQHRVDRDLKNQALQIEVCRRFMEIPGVGPICALTFYAIVSEPSRFRRSADIGSYFGLTPLIRQSGLKSTTGRISKMGNKAARTALVNAAISFVRWSSHDSDLRSWAVATEKRRGAKKARVALARKLASVMLALWKGGQSYRANGAVGRSTISDQTA